MIDTPTIPELLPCPFCGSPAPKDFDYDGDEPVYYATCSNQKCPINNTGMPCDVWNTRTIIASTAPRDATDGAETLAEKWELRAKELQHKSTLPENHKIADIQRGAADALWACAGELRAAASSTPSSSTEAEARAVATPVSSVTGPCSACGDGDTALKYHSHGNSPSSSTDIAARDCHCIVYYKEGVEHPRGHKPSDCAFAAEMTTPTKEWRPMATIPRDGSDVLLLRLAKTSGHPIWIGRADSNPATEYVWLVARGEAPFSNFDGWLPLPPLPTLPELRKP